MEQPTYDASYYQQKDGRYLSTAYQPVSPGWSSTGATPQYEAPQQFSPHPYGSASQPLSFFRSLRWWLVEIFASLISVISFIALVFVARHYQGHGVDEVSIAPSLTLNGLIALLSTVNRVALMIPVASALSQEVWTWLCESNGRKSHRRQLRDLELSDEASRGAWGSVKFLFHPRRSLLAYFAAIVTILTLAFGTFTQQLLTIKSFPVRDPSLVPGGLAHSNKWQEWSGRPSEGPLNPPLPIKAAAYTSVLTASTQSLTASCPTGNCTWPITPSMGICGGCVGSQFEISCSASSAMCTYTMPSGETANLTDWAEASEGMGFQVFPSSGSHFDTSRTDILYVANFEAVGAPNGSTALTSWQNKTTVASECALWMCLKSFETKSVNGQQTEIVTQEFYSVENSSAIEDMHSLFDNVTFLTPPEALNAMPSVAYNANAAAIGALQTYLTTLFNGSIFLNQDYQLPTTDAMLGIWNSSADLDPWIKNVAASLTNVIRVSQPSDESFYYGTASQLGYNVRWAWISLPAAMVVMSLFILAAIIIRTARSPVRAWKGSLLVVLFTDVDPALRVRASGGMDTFEGIEKAIGKTVVYLNDKGNKEWSIKAL